VAAATLRDYCRCIQWMQSCQADAWGDRGRNLDHSISGLLFWKLL